MDRKLVSFVLISLLFLYFKTVPIAAHQENGLFRSSAELALDVFHSVRRILTEVFRFLRDSFHSTIEILISDAKSTAQSAQEWFSAYLPIHESRRLGHNKLAG